MGESKILIAQCEKCSNTYACLQCQVSNLEYLLGKAEKELSRVSKLKPRWDDHGEFYKYSDVKPIVRKSTETLRLIKEGRRG